MEIKCYASVLLTGNKSISANNVLLYEARNSLLGEKGTKHYIGKACHPHTNNKWGALSLAVAWFTLFNLFTPTAMQGTMFFPHLT